MPNCDMCGKDADLFLANIEETELSVCQSCARYGKVIKRIQPVVKQEKKSKITEKEPEPEIVEKIVEDYAQKIRRVREQLGLSHKEFARKINEKESWLHNIETGKYEPSIKIARKLERILGIKLVEEIKDEKENIKLKTKKEEFTIGDFIKNN
jgi:putative transcription factor